MPPNALPRKLHLVRVKHLLDAGWVRLKESMHTDYLSVGWLDPLNDEIVSATTARERYFQRLNK